MGGFLFPFTARTGFHSRFQRGETRRSLFGADLSRRTAKASRPMLWASEQRCAVAGFSERCDV